MTLRSISANAVCTVAYEVLCMECMSFYHFFGRDISYFLLLLCLFLALVSICKTARTEAVSSNHTVLGSLKRAEPLTASDCY